MSLATIETVVCNSPASRFPHFMFSKYCALSLTEKCNAGANGINCGEKVLTA